MEVKAIEFHRILNVSDQNVNMTSGPNAVLTFNHPLQEKKSGFKEMLMGMF